MKYIGKHKRTQDSQDPDDSWYLGSGKYLQRAVDKYGAENFRREILCECSSEEELVSAERRYISIYNAVESPDYYNLVEDSNPPILRGDSHPNKSGKFWRGPNGEDLSKTPEICARTSERMKTNNPMKCEDVKEKVASKHIGVPLTEEHRSKLSKTLKGKPKSVETRSKMSKSQKGHSTSDATKSKISSTLKSLYESPEYMEKYKESRKSIRYHKVCAICQKEFLGYSSRSKYCPSCKEVRGWI